MFSSRSFIKYRNPRERNLSQTVLSTKQTNKKTLCICRHNSTHCIHEAFIITVHWCVRFAERKTSPMRLVPRSYLHKQLDNGLVIRLYSVLRYRQRHCGYYYLTFAIKWELLGFFPSCYHARLSSVLFSTTLFFSLPRTEAQQALCHPEEDPVQGAQKSG